MPWALKAHDAGVQEGDGPSVVALRNLIAAAVAAANTDANSFTGVHTSIDAEHGFAAMLVCVDGRPSAVRIGDVYPPTRPELIEFMEGMGAEEVQVGEIYWRYDIPLHQV